MRKCSTLIIGSGESGIEAAEYLASRGEHVIICEEERLGGNHISNHDLNLKDGLEYGKNFERYLDRFKPFKETYSILKKDRDGLYAMIQSKAEERLENLKNSFVENPYIEIVAGKARLISPSLVEVSVGEDRELISFDSCICAVGKQELQMPFVDGADLPNVWDEYSILNAEKLPTSVAIVGCTEETMNFAFLFANIGIKVSIIEQKRSDECLPRFDKTILNVLFKKLLSKQVSFHFNTSVSGIVKEGRNLTVYFDNESLSVSDVLVSSTKMFDDTIGAQEAGLKFTANGFVTNLEGKVYGSEKIYAVGEANDKYDKSKAKEILNNCLYAISNDPKHKKTSKNKTTTAITPVSQSSEAEYLRVNQNYPRIIGSFEGVTIGLSEHESKGLNGPASKSDAYETKDGDIVKIVYHAQTEKLLGVSMSGQISRECLVFALYCLDKRRKHGEFSTYLRNFLELL